MLLVLWTGTKPMLGPVFWPGFSKTARPRPCHREAGRHRHHDASISVFGRRDADDVAEGAAERAQAAEADVEAHVRHASLGLSKQEHGALDAPSLQVAMRGLAKGRFEGANEVRLGNVGDGREAVDVERLSVGAVDRVSGAEHSAVDLLDGLGHALITVAAWGLLAGKRARR